MAEKGKSFPIPCRKCGKLSIFHIKEGTHHLTCFACTGMTQVDVHAIGEGWEIRTSLSAARGLPKK